jgi:hypothetical protein
MLPYLAILAMQIKTVINDNDYEFHLSSLNSIYQSLGSLNTTSFTSSSAANSAASSSHSIASTITGSSSTYSAKDTAAVNSHQQIQNQQQDLARICVLLFDIYQKMCLPQPHDQLVNIYISRQSIQESLLPGLSCLFEIFHNKIIMPTGFASNNSLSTLTNHNNEFSAQIDRIAARVEKMMATDASPNLAVTSTVDALSVSLNATPTKAAATAVANLNSAAAATLATVNANLSDLMSSGVNALSNTAQLTTPVTTMASQLTTGIGGSAENSNFKSFFSKGISSFKDQSKDRFSNFLLTNKNAKK